MTAFLSRLSVIRSFLASKSFICWFAKKKVEYLKSKIAVAKSIGETDIDEWNLDCITKRDIRVSDEIIGILNNWNQDYLKTFDAKNDPDKGPSAEELAKIEEFKKKGWI